ncbi:MAG: hypothetical protein L3J88_04660 [Gammaproteobacteria bacterium]|nr:hypothetical protein [Gammaproteobacteria bacterium]MCF6362631.1 hypothetical protein [Gammaproteobacteria bacterium]
MILLPAQRLLDASGRFCAYIIGFGDPGYVVLYCLDGDTVYVLAFRHQKEAGY